MSLIQQWFLSRTSLARASRHAIETVSLSFREVAASGAKLLFEFF
jgi:hypothetical protein